MSAEQHDSGWWDNFISDTSNDLMTSSCLLYSDLSTWDLRDMSFDNNEGYYYAYDYMDEIVFNPCRQIDFAASYEYKGDMYQNYYPNLERFADNIDYGAFAVLYNGNTDGSYIPLNKYNQWDPDSQEAIFLPDENGHVSYDEADGLSVFYKTEQKCDGDTVYSFKYDVMCDKEMVEDGTFKAAT